MWIIPSLGRPVRLAETLAAIRAVGCSTPGLVLVGPTDPLPAPAELPAGWQALRRDPADVSMPAGLNRAFALHPDAPWYGYLGDDTVVRTPGWDRALIEAAGPAGFASCNDGWQAAAGRMAGILCFGGELVRAFGFIHPPMLQHCYGDDFWEDVAARFGNWTVLDWVCCEHRSALADPGPNQVPADRAHELAYAGAEADREAWQRWRGSLNHMRLLDRVALALGRPRLSLELACERSVMIATPVYRDTSWRYTLALANTVEALTRLGIRHVCRFVIGNSNLPKARNELVAQFLASDFTDLLMIDADMGWDADAVIRLLASQHRLIGGVGRRKTLQRNDDPHAWCVRHRPGDFEQDAYGAIKVQWVGTGMLRINRAVFELLLARHENWWKRTGRPDLAPAVRLHYHQFFRFDPDRMDELSEDFVFCERAAEVGVSTWIDPEIRLSHAGEADYGGRVSESFEALRDERDEDELEEAAA